MKRLTSGLVMGLSCLLTSVACGQDFRIETDVFYADETEPAVSTLTLFRGSTVYDFMGSDEQEITILDINRGRFVLIDCKRQVRTSLTTDQLLRFAANLKASASGSSKVLVNAKLTESLEDDGTLVLAGTRVTYTVKTLKPPNADVVKRYRAFADWYARLNATRVGNLPPFARLQLNGALAQRGLVPQVVTRVVRTGNLLSTDHLLRTNHLVNWQLTNTDRKRISRAGDYMATYREVTPVMYWK